MKYLKISNKGELDIRLIALMGGTTKANAKYKIGQFGTGLKYTLAYLFRNNLDFKVFSGEKEAQITTEKEDIQGTEFEIICINGQRTSITTGMGMEWKPWMIIRELWSNSLDEGDAKKVITEELIGKEGTTSFYIQINPEIQEVISSWDQYFMPEDEKAIFENGKFKVYPSTGNLCIYKNGILILRDPDQKSVFSYDYMDARINELREFKDSRSFVVSSAIKLLDSESINYFVNNVGPDDFEGSPTIDYNWFQGWSEAWKSFVINSRLITEKIKSRYSSYGYDYDNKAYATIPQVLYNALSHDLGETGEIAKTDNKEGGISFFPIEGTDVERKVKICLQELSDIGYEIDKKTKILYGIYKIENSYIVVENNRILVNLATKDLDKKDIKIHLVRAYEQVRNKIKDNVNHFVSLYLDKLSKDREEMTETSPVEQIYLGFELTMPNVGSWNGKWTGEGDLYYQSRKVTLDKLKEIMEDESVKSYHYDFGDSWAANVRVYPLDKRENDEKEQKSKGFSTYSWMIDSILDIGQIMTNDNRWDYNKSLQKEKESVKVPDVSDEDVETHDDFPF